MHRQADVMQIVLLHDGLAGIATNGVVSPTVFQGIDGPVGDLLGIEEVDEQPIATAPNDFLHGLSPRTHDEATCGHRFEHGPGEHERIGQIEVDSRYLQNFYESRVRYLSQEVDSERSKLPCSVQNLALLPATS